MAIGEYTISIAGKLWADSVVEERWYAGDMDAIQIRHSIRECVGILCGVGENADSSEVGLRATLELAIAADTNNMPVCVLLLDGPVGHAALEKLGAVSDVYPSIHHALGDCPGLEAKAKVIYDVVEDFGKANNWISYAAYKRGS